MKSLNKPIAMIANFTTEGSIVPMRFRVYDGYAQYTVIEVEKVLRNNFVKSGGQVMNVYDCLSVINGIQKNLQIRYATKDCKWYLYKID